MSIPVGWGSTYCFTAVGVGVHAVVRVTPITKGSPAQMFFGWHVLCSPGDFDFCYDLHIWAQGEALRVFFVLSIPLFGGDQYVQGQAFRAFFFPLFSQEYEGVFDQTLQDHS